MSGVAVSADVVSSLLHRIEQRDEAAHKDLVRLLTLEIQARSASKRYFPLSALRESCRQLLKQGKVRADGLLVFYCAFADAILSLMVSSTDSSAARAGQALLNTVRDFDHHKPGSGILLRLHYLAGLNWDETRQLPGAVEKIGDPTVAMAEVARALQALGCSEEVLKAQNLRPRGDVTRLLEEVRDGQRSLGEVVASEQPKLERQAARLLQMERGISLQPADLVNEMFLRMPRDPAKAPVNRMEFEALSRRVMRHILIDRARKAIPGQSRYSAELAGDLAAPAPAVEDRLFLQKLMATVEKVLKDLRRTDRETAEMLYATLYRGADQKQLAKLHSVSVSTVKRRLKDARHRIRKQLGLS